MSSRYRVARAMGKFDALVEEDSKLLDAFGLQLLSVSGGLRAVAKNQIKGNTIHPWNVMTIDVKTWDWLQPLLVQLRDTKS